MNLTCDLNERSSYDPIGKWGGGDLSTCVHLGPHQYGKDTSFFYRIVDFGIGWMAPSPFLDVFFLESTCLVSPVAKCNYHPDCLARAKRGKLRAVAVTMRLSGEKTRTSFVQRHAALTR